jgi:hypothetical protein
MLYGATTYELAVPCEEISRFVLETSLSYRLLGSLDLYRISALQQMLAYRVF